MFEQLVVNFFNESVNVLNYKIIVRFIPASKVLYYSEHSLRVSYLAMVVLTYNHCSFRAVRRIPSSSRPSGIAE